MNDGSHILKLLYHRVYTVHILSHYCIIWCNDILLLYCATAPRDKLSLVVLLWKSCVVQLVKWCILYKHVIIGYGPNIIALILIIYGPNQKHEKDICGGPTPHLVYLLYGVILPTLNGSIAFIGHAFVTKENSTRLFEF